MKDKIELGNYKVASKWEDITLKQWQDYLRLIGESEDGKIDVADTIVAFSNIPKEELMQMPTPVFEKILSHMSFLTEEPIKEPTNKVVINNETYAINFMDKLKVQEYLDVNTVLSDDRYNYALIFAILCRRYEEVYDDDFIANKIDDRIKMFEDMSVMDALGLISFFLHLYLKSQRLTQSYLAVEELKSEVEELVKSTDNSLRHMGYRTLFMLPQISKLRKYKKSLRCI